MKITILLIAVLIATLQTFGGEKKSKVDPKDAKIDTLTMQNKSLTAQLDSVSREMARYTGMYSVLYEKVFHYKFLPEKTSFLIDSLRTSRDSVSVLIGGAHSMASDSVMMLMKENKTLMAKIDSVKMAWEKEKTFIPAEDIEHAKVITGLKQLKELLDEKIISDSEFLVLKKKYVEKL
jgi:outer membrane murein-binding lipoprotein Lpp